MQMEVSHRSERELIDTLWNVNLNAADVVQLKREN